MDFPQYKELVQAIPIGKRLPDSIYVHESALSNLPQGLSKLALRIADALSIPDEEWNILKFYQRDFKIAYLSYPGFEQESYPPLRHSFTVDLSRLSMRKADYSDSDNPPILHRKETFVDESYPLRSLFLEITQEGEAAGLYERPRAIGFRKNWERVIQSKGYFLDKNGRLQSDDNIEETSDEINEFETERIERHKTAIDRNQLSQPMRVLARHEYLSGDYSVLDYGCGKGDDLKELEAHGIDASGWDPAYLPDGDLSNADIVNLGFVLNVIEDRAERDETLRRAWEYTEKLLVVSVMIAGDSIINQFRSFKDGVLTSRNTFQKYYAQSEFRSYIESVLDQIPIAAGQGIFLVFKDKLEEQEFLLERQHIHRDWQQRTQRTINQRVRSIRKDLVDKNLELFTDFWQTSLDLGRVPANSEFEFSEQIRRVAGSHRKAHQALLTHFGDDLFEEAKQKRKEDLLVYFALSLFEKRKAQSKLPESLKRDIKAFFASYSGALELAKEELFNVGDPSVIESACIKAYDDLGSGEFNEGHDYIVHINHLNDLPTELRIYIGCATQLYGDLEGIQLIKIHMLSGKVSLMKYANWESETPLLVERIKIKMRDQDIDFFDYSGKYEPQPLYNKAAYL